MRDFLTVSEVARFLEVSPQRVRFLLAQGRISGHKDERDIWRISVPFRMTRSLRGLQPAASSRIFLSRRSK